MDKIVLYGAGETFKCFQKYFLEFTKENKAAIVGVADRSLQGGKFCGYPVLALNEIAGIEPDFVVVTAAGEAAKSIAADLANTGIPEKKIVNVVDYHLVDEEMRKIDEGQLPVQLDIIKELLSATDEEVSSFEWMRSIIGRYGIYPWHAEDFNGEGGTVGTRAGVMQRPREFAQYCVYLSKYKIETAIEVGVFRGKSSYFMCALLARKNPNLIYELVDIADDLSNFEEFHELLPQMRKRIPSTSDDYIGKAYDFVFIDADHSYDASMRDYMNLGQYAKKMTVFHDIYAHEYDNLNGGTVRMWNEVMDMTSQHKHHVFSEHPDEWMGIGVIEHSS